MAPPTDTWPNLIYDVGAADGEDSAHYLSQGYRVVAVEARPDAIAKLQGRFAAEIADGRLTLVAKGIAEQSGEATFWLSEDRPACSTFNEEFMRRLGGRHRAITLPTVTFRELLEEFGRATYCKIDIEGSDHLFLDDPLPELLPRYLSLEILETVEPLVRRLGELGYRRFKLISQRSFDQPSAGVARAKSRLPKLPFWLRRAYRRIAGVFLNLTRRAVAGPSGPFGEDTAGRWLSGEEATSLLGLSALRTQKRPGMICTRHWEIVEHHGSRNRAPPSLVSRIVRRSNADIRPPQVTGGGGCARRAAFQHK